MLAILAQTLTAAAQAPPESILEAIGPLVAIGSLLYAGWAKIRAARLATMLKAVAVGVKAYMDALPAAEAEDVKSTIKAAAVREGVNEALKQEVRKATAPAIVVPRDLEPPRLPGILLVLALLLGASGCVQARARELAEAHHAHLVAIRWASVPHPSYLVDDAEPGEDGRKLTASEKTAAWERAQAEALRGARELVDALGGTVSE